MDLCAGNCKIGTTEHADRFADTEKKESADYADFRVELKEQGE